MIGFARGSLFTSGRIEMKPKPNLAYGVIFSVWNGEDYVIEWEKGLDACNLGSPTVKEHL